MDINRNNSTFWDELCGSQAAEMLGITDISKDSLGKFDNWYFEFYPYLKKYVNNTILQDTTILEVGLGFGTLSQYLAEQQTTYIGLDVSLGPTRMVQHRLKQCNLKGEVVSGSINTSPFADKSFDAIIAIGSLHHTGDLTRSIEEVHRLLKPGGKFIFMVYYSYSYRRWRQAFKQTLNYFIKEIFEYRGVVPNLSSAKNRAAYDVNKKGEAAPHTDWISKKSAKALLRKFSHISLELENIDEAFAFGFKSREKLVISKWPKKFGLDLYGEATK